MNASVSLEHMLYVLNEEQAYCASLPEHRWHSPSSWAICMALERVSNRDPHLSDVAVSILETVDEMAYNNQLPRELVAGPEWAALLTDIAGLEPGDDPYETDRASACIAQVEAAIVELDRAYPGLDLGPANAAIEAAKEKVGCDFSLISPHLFAGALPAAVLDVARVSGRSEEAIWRSLDLIEIIRAGLSLPRRDAGCSRKPP